MSAFRSLIVLAAVVCAAPLGLAAQQVPVSAASSASAPAAPGPRVESGFTRAEPVMRSSSPAPRSMYKEQHTIVISTLVLVLAIVILVLLIA